MAKRITDEDLRLNLIINGDGGRKEMLALDRQMKDLQGTVKKTRSELKEMEKAGKSGSAEHQRLTAALTNQEKALNECRDKYNKLQSTISLENKTLAELRNHLKMTSAALSKAVPGTENWKNLNAEVQRTKARLKELTSQAGQTKGVLERLSSIKAGAVAAFAAVAGAIRGIASAFGKIADFEQANANLSTIIGKNVKDIEAMTYSAMDLGRTTEYTASQVTLLQTELAKLGFKEGSIMAMQESVLHFATAIGTTLPEAAAMAGATLRMFGLEAKDTEDTLAVLTAGANNSALGFSYYQTAMATVGPVAKTFGFSLRDTVALLGTLANAGFDASSAATATRNILLNLADSSGKLAVSLGKPVSTFPELMDGLRQLKAQGVDLNTTLELTDKRSVSAFNTFLDGADAAMELRDSLDDVNGVLKSTAEERINTVEGSVKLLQSAWEGLILSFRESTGPIKEVIDWLTKLIEVTSDLVSSGSKQSFYKDFSEDFARKLEDFHGNEEVLKSYIQEARKIYEQGLSQAQATYDNQSGFSRWWHYSGDKLNIARNALEGFNLAAEQYEKEPSTSEEDTSGNANTNGPTTNGTSSGKIKEAKQWSLNSDEAYLKARAELTRMYNEKEIGSQEEYDERIYQLEVATLTARLATRKDAGAARAKIENDLQDKVKKHSEDALKRQQENEKKAGELVKEGAAVIAAAETDKTKAALTAEETRYAAELKKFKDTKVLYENQAAVIEAIEKKHQVNLMKIRMDAEAKEMERIKNEHEIQKEKIKNDYSGQMLNLPVGPSAKKSSLQRSMNSALISSDLEYLESLRIELEKITTSKTFDGGLIPEEDLKKYELQLQQTIEKITELKNKQKEDTVGAFSGNGKGSLFGVSQEQWSQFFANLSDGKMKADDLANALTGMGGLAQEGFRLASKAIELTNAKENKAFKEYQKDNENKKKSLKSRYDAGLLSQEQYNAKVEEMETEEEARREEMELRQAKRTKTMNLIQSIINTALSVTKTLAQWGWPAGAAPAAIVGAFGAAQTALIAAQPVGAEEGGFVDVRRAQDGKAFKARLSPDKRGFVSSPTVLVGENGGEYVIPAEGLSNPSLLPFVATLEEARKAGTLRSLNFEAVYPVGSAVGRESGGFAGNAAGTQVASTGSATGSGASTDSATDRKLLEAIELLNQRLSAPIKADVSMLGKNGIIEQTERYNRAKRRATYGK